MSDLLAALDDASSDKELFDAASHIVSYPKVPGDDFSDGSFVLHAPLEICARYFLLPLVEDDYVAGARKQIRLTSKRYDAFENADVPHGIRTTFGEFSMESADIDKWATSLYFASHATILLALQANVGETNQFIHNVLWRMKDSIESSFEAQMAWTKLAPVTGDIAPDLLKHPQKWFIDHVGNIEHVSGGDGPIRESVERVEATGVIEPLITTLGAIANFSERANFDIPFQALMRTAALAMIVEPDDHAKYGWTHCLTIPHSHWVLSPHAVSASRMLQAATTHAATFRALMGTTELSEEKLAEYFEEDETSVFAEHHVRIRDIVSVASTMVDAHLVKYVYTCFDLMKRDPQYSRLYIDAAQKLLDIWRNDAGDTSD